MIAPILVDCDGVLANMDRSVLALAAEHGILDKTEADITTWDYADCLGWIGVDAAVDRAVREREFVYRMQPYPGAFMALRRLEATFGVDNVFVCTATSSGDWAHQRYDWLRDFAGVAHKRVIMTTAKRHVAGFLIDDKPKNLEGRPWEQAFLVARPHNASERRFIRGTLEQAVENLINNETRRPRWTGTDNGHSVHCECRDCG